jgi:hypothetical protein
LLPLAPLLLVTALAGRGATARELTTAPPSPRASLSQVVGLTRVDVDYERPALRGGSPSGWEVAPRITFDRDLLVFGAPVAAGSYRLLMTPRARTWTVILSRDRYMSSVARHRADLDVVRWEVPVVASAHVERPTFSFSNFSEERGSLDFEWGNARIAIPLEVSTAAEIEAKVASLDDGWRWFADAADYLLRTRKDYDAGLRYIDRSLALNQNPENVRIKAALLAAKKGNDGARGTYVAAAQTSRHERREQGRKRRLSLAGDDFGAHNFHAAIQPGAIPSDGIEDPPIVAPPARSARAPSAAEIGSVVKKGRPEIEACYQRALRRDPSLTRARLTISITVASGGRVERVGFDPPDHGGALESCVRGAVAHWVFPTSPSEYGTEFPVFLRGAD